MKGIKISCFFHPCTSYGITINLNVWILHLRWRDSQGTTREKFLLMAHELLHPDMCTWRSIGFHHKKGERLQRRRDSPKRGKRSPKFGEEISREGRKFPLWRLIIAFGNPNWPSYTMDNNSYPQCALNLSSCLMSLEHCAMLF